MKKTILLVTLAIYSLVSFSQLTTETEYRYMKNGYRQVAESGLDVKQGYTAQEQKIFIAGQVSLTFTLLKRTDGTLAGTILKTVSNEGFGSGTNYYAIPAANTTTDESFGWELFYKDLDNMSYGIRKYVIEWLAYRFSFLTANMKK